MLKKAKDAAKSPRNIMSVLTVAVLALIIYLTRDSLLQAWDLLGQANLGLLALLVPLQILVYFAGGEMIFSYLRRRKLIGHISWFEQTRIALELNLVNHVFPSGGVSGISYTTWRLHKLGVSSAKSTFAQMIRYVAGFVSLMIMIVIAVLVLAIDGGVNRYIVSSSFALVLVVFALVAALFYMFSSDSRMNSAARSITRLVNRLMLMATLGRKRGFVDHQRVKKFFVEMQRDFDELMADKKLLIRPLIWGAFYATIDVLMFMVTFWALGASVDPAILLVGYGVAGLAGLVAFTPGGAGVYELIMIFFLKMAGVEAQVAIAGILLTRTILLAGTIIFGYIFYQHALFKYGKKSGPKI